MKPIQNHENNILRVSTKGATSKKLIKNIYESSAQKHITKVRKRNTFRKDSHG